MSKKSLTIISKSVNTADFLMSTLKELFADDIAISNYAFERDKLKSPLKADLFLVPDRTIFEEANKYVQSGKEIRVIKRTLTKSGFNKLMEIEPGTQAMLVNVNANMAIDTISLISQLGARNLDLTPVFPGINNIPDLDLAITPGEEKYVPSNVKKVINIGDRVPGISTIMDIIIKFQLNHLMSSPKIINYFNNIVPISFGLEKILGKTNSLEGQLDMISKLLEVGVLGINKKGVINSVNENALKIINKRENELIGRQAAKIFKNIQFPKVLQSADFIKEKIVKVDGTDIVLSVNPVKNLGEAYGAVAIIKKFSDTEKRQQKLRAQLIHKGHVAKYTFADITGNSKKLEKCKKIAKRMAKSESTILLTGESGTGKELFAQAIHNTSNRKNAQFVAVNCAALPENLLESELFGYAEGAFTGAKKDGKPGLFELAHKGTLLLDEIGEIPLELQARLLRVLEEREVMRIGGERVINVDVRIIAASNRDLYELMQENKFREDLYYRLSILPLRIPPLRERKEDILPLIEEFKREFKSEFVLSDAIKDRFLKHRWNGNVRELRNYIEYLSNLKKQKITLEDLPFTMNKEENRYQKDEDEILVERLTNKTDKCIDDYTFVLSVLNDKYNNNERCGRRSISEAAVKEGLFLSEQEIRSILKTLGAHNLVNIKRGRAGTIITERGKRILKILKMG